MRTIDEIIVHCTGTPEGRYVTVEDIDKMHRQRGWKCIGYHYVIYIDGSLHKGRAEENIGAHCEGRNLHSIGICYVGGCEKNMKPKDTRTAAQKATLVKIAKDLKARYPGSSIHGHNEYSNKECPCFDVQKWRKEVGL